MPERRLKPSPCRPARSRRNARRDVRLPVPDRPFVTDPKAQSALRRDTDLRPLRRRLLHGRPRVRWNSLTHPPSQRPPLERRQRSAALLHARGPRQRKVPTRLLHGNLVLDPRREPVYRKANHGSFKELRQALEWSDFTNHPFGKKSFTAQTLQKSILRGDLAGAPIKECSSIVIRPIPFGATLGLVYW